MSPFQSPGFIAEPLLVPWIDEVVWANVRIAWTAGFHLRGTKPGKGELVVGFRDLRTKEVTHRKSIPVAVDGDDEHRS